MAAIAYDAVYGGSNNGLTTLTYSHTVADHPNRIILAGVMYGGLDYSVDNITGVTYGGQAMTLIARQRGTQGNIRLSFWYLVAPAINSNSVVTTASVAGANQYIYTNTVSYYNVSQSSPIDSSASDEGNSVTPRSLTTTVLKNNCWLVATWWDNTGSSSAGTGTTERKEVGGNCIFDSNGPVAAGSRSLSVVNTDDSDGWVLVSLAPYLPAGGNPMFMSSGGIAIG